MKTLLPDNPRALYDAATEALSKLLRKFLRGFLGRFDPRARPPGPAPWYNDPLQNKNLLSYLWREYESLCQALRITRLAWLVTALLAVVGWAV